jgi:hypothetical protein
MDLQATELKLRFGRLMSRHKLRALMLKQWKIMMKIMKIFKIILKIMAIT